MRRSLKFTGLMIAAVGSLALSACKVERDEPQPSPTPSESPRSIFQEDGGEPVVTPTRLPPLETTLSFADGTDELTEAVRAELATILDSPQIAQGGLIVLRGHSDLGGEEADPVEASRIRAEAVRDFMTEAGIEEDRIEIIAFGGQNPLKPNALPDGTPNEEGRAANRRVEVTVETGEANEREQTIIETLSTPTPGTSPSARQTTGVNPRS